MISPQTLGICLIALVALNTGHCTEIPGCIFDNTVDLTDAHKFPNGSYLYRENIIIPPDQVGIYDYEILYNDLRLPRELHPRGCLCKERICIKFCCHPTKELISNGTTLCTKLKEDLKYDPYINMIYKNLSSVRRNAIEDFIVIQGTPCENAYPLMPELYSNDKWDIYENGGMMRHHDGVILKRLDYCLMPIRDSRDEWKLSAFNCPIPNTAATYNLVYSIFGIISTLFILATVLFYVILPELQSLRGKSLISYILCLAVGNMIMIIVSMREDTLPSFVCSSLGFMAYFFYESSFIWANVMGYDLWQNSKNVGQFVEDKKLFRKYTGYTYGVALCLTVVLMILQYSEMADQYKPGIGGGVCWLNTSSWSTLIYFFGLNAIIFSFNIIFYVMTTLEEVPVLRKNDEVTRCVQAHTKNVRIYFLLLCILGTSWCLNTGSYLEDMWKPNEKHIIRYMADIMNCLEGPLIFWILVVTTKSIYLLIRRKTSGSAYVPQLTEYSDDENTSQF